MPPCNNGATTFRELRWSSYFVDKTLFIKEVFNRRSKVLLITAPPRFGKSINLSTIREFVEQKQNINENDRNPFEGTNIWKEDEIKPHFHRYIVIYVSFYGAPLNKKDAIDDLAFAVSRAYMEHAYLQNSQKLSPGQLLNCKRWCNYTFTKSVLPDSDFLDEIKMSLHNLKMALEIHHGPEAKFVILIDEFDQIVTNAMFRVDTEKDLEDIARIRDSILNIIKHYNDNVIFSLLTGIVDVTSVSESLINNDERYAFLQNEFFFPYYGFLETEFDDVVKRNKIPDDFCEEMKQQYNGYICYGKRLYNTWSVTTAMHMNKIGNYFSRKNLIIQLTPILRDHTMEELIKEIMANSIIPYTYPSNPCLLTKDLFKLAQCCKCSNVTIDKYAFLNILFQMGYLTFVEKEKLKVSNLSIVNTLKYMYYCHFKTHWHDRDENTSEM